MLHGFQPFEHSAFIIFKIPFSPAYLYLHQETPSQTVVLFPHLLFILFPTKPLFLNIAIFRALLYFLEMGILGDKVSSLKLLDRSLRLFVIPLTIASIWLTVTNQQDNSTYGKLEFDNLMGLKYLVSISAISAGYALVAAIGSWINCLVTKPWLFFVSDQVIAYLLVTSGAALAEILYLAYHGNQKVSWSEACSAYGKFCDRLRLVLALQVISLCCFLLLAVFSAFRAFSRFEPPFVSSKEVEEERA